MIIKYRIPLSHALVILGILSLFPLGSHDYLDDSFAQSEAARAISLYGFIGTLLYFLLTPRGKKITLTPAGISVPNLLFPPYRERTLQWHEIHDYKIRYNANGTQTLILITEYGEVKIHCWLCFGNFEIVWSPKAYVELEHRASCLAKKNI